MIFFSLVKGLFSQTTLKQYYSDCAGKVSQVRSNLDVAHQALNWKCLWCYIAVVILLAISTDVERACGALYGICALSDKTQGGTWLYILSPTS